MKCLLLLAPLCLYTFWSFEDVTLYRFQQNVGSIMKDGFSGKPAVLGVAAGYDLSVFKRFVGSLRATGYSGHIILGVEPNLDEDIAIYLKGQNVITKPVETTLDECTYHGAKLHNGESYAMKCFKDYPDYKMSWGRFAFYRDWLHECDTCSGGVMLTDVRDVFFQRDPFQNKEKLRPLMLFEEIPELTTGDWITTMPLSICKKEFHFHAEKMICSGSTMGSTQAILDYIDVMLSEFENWKAKDQCRIDMVGDDQSIHNYLYYTNKFHDAITIPHRTGPIHVVGVQAALIYRRAKDEIGGQHQSVLTDYYAKNKEKWQNWLPERDNLIDPNTGLILNLDGTPSPQVHQIDRFMGLISGWLQKMEELDWPYNKPTDML